MDRLSGNDSIVYDAAGCRKKKLLLSERNASLAMLSEIAADLMSDLETETLLQKVLRYATSSMNTEHGSISFIDFSAKDRYVRWAQGPILQGYIGVRIPFGMGLGSAVIAAGERRIVKNYQQYENRLPYEDFDGISTVVGIPLRWRDEVFGYLSVYYEGEPRELEEAKLKHLDQFAFLASLALHNATLYEEAQRELKERRRLEEELRMATQEAERANAAKSDFLARMSHEIRTPLNVLTGMSDLLLQRYGDCELREDLVTIAQTGRFLAEMVNDILDFSRIEAGRVDIEHIPFSLADLTGELSSVFGFHAKQSGILFRSTTAPLLFDLFLGDPLRIKQILFNLLGNAVKFTLRGEVALSVKGSPLPDGRFRLLFTVSDTGKGMRPEELEEIFEPYRQGSGSVPRRFGGSGLGLPISRKLAELMGGSLSVESVPGKGSSFTLDIPLQIARSSVEGVEAVNGQATLPEELSILVVDDNIMNRTLLSRLLALPGWSVLLADDGEKAVEIADRNSPDVVILDLEMPKLDGLAAARAIRGGESASGKRAFILGLTGYAPSEVLPLCIEAGMDDCLGKPARKQAILASIAKHFSSRS